MAVTSLFLSFLMLGVCCGDFTVSVPQKIEVMSGSCVTIPCSFTIERDHEKNFHNGCKGFWHKHKDSSFPITMTAVVKGKDCTTTITSVNHTDKYAFRLDCENDLIWFFFKNPVSIVVQDHPLNLTLTAPTLSVREGTVVNLRCSTPAPCWPHLPTLTWTPGLGHSQETLENNSDKTKVKTSVLTFTASYKHDGNEICCTAVHKKQDGTPDVTVQQSTNISVSYSPKDTKILLSSSGPVTVNSNVTLTCSSLAKPPVKNYSWYEVEGQNETLVGTGKTLKSKVSTGRRMWLCKAENHVGVGRSTLALIEVQCTKFPPLIPPATQEFSVPKNQGQMILLILITTNILFFLLVCLLLFIIRKQKINTTPSTQLEKENEVSDTAEATNDGSVIYSSVKWKAKKQRSPPKSFSLEENHRKVDSGQRFVSSAVEMGSMHAVKPRVLRKEADCDYAQVKFKNKSASRK